MPATTNTQYAQIPDFNALGAFPQVFASVPQAMITQQLQAASSYINGYLKAKYSMPLVSWDQDIIDATCVRAAYRLLFIRGIRPGSAEYDMVRDMWRDTLAWLKDVARGEVTPDVVDSSTTPIPGETIEAVIISSPQRGYSNRGSGSGGNNFDPFTDDRPGPGNSDGGWDP